MTTPNGAEPTTPAPAEPATVTPGTTPAVPAEPTTEATPSEPAHDAAWWESKAKAMEKEAKAKTRRLAELEAAEQARSDAEKTELQRAQERAAAAEAKAKAAELAVSRRDVVAEAKLPPELADFLQGNTPEELRASAEKLLKSLPAKTPPPAGQVLNPGDKAIHAGETDADRRKRLGIG